MSVIKVGFVTGKCGRCGKSYTRKRPAFSIICDCYKICPLCGQEMTPHTPDLTLSTYQSEKGLNVLYVCNNHEPPYHSDQKPVEVKLT